jgi:Rod binding domain-containing protein
MTVSAVTATIAGERAAPAALPVGPSAGAAASQPSFAATLESAARTGAASPGAAEASDSGRTVHQHSKSGELKPLQQFESFVLRSFIENMMPTEEASFFGTGSAGKIWKSMLAERMADEMSASGGIGIADMLGKAGKGGEADAAKTSGPSGR